MGKVRIKGWLLKGAMIVIVLVLAIMVIRTSILDRSDLRNSMTFSSVSKDYAAVCIIRGGDWNNETDTFGCKGANIFNCPSNNTMGLADKCTELKANWYCNTTSTFCSYK